jgi:endonuclease/exonuclease/phosphatase family metal-dependent hydrolase
MTHDDDAHAGTRRPLLGSAPGFPSLEPVHESRFHSELAAWRGNIGDAVALDLATAAPRTLRGLDIVCWNVAVGKGDLDALLHRIQSDAYDGFGHDPARPLVLLLQEAFRGGGSVPPHVTGLHHGGHRTIPGRTDIVELAERWGLSIRYSPSMRNGHHPSDRGNAILANVALDDTHAFLLPYVRQRRVALTTHIAGMHDIVLATAHLDTGGRRRGGPLFTGYGAGRLAQSDELLARLVDPDHNACVVLGADLNTALGVRDPVVRSLVSGGFHPATRVGKWWHTYHTRIRMHLDHVLFRSPTDRIEAVAIARVDEVPGDRSVRVFGSDHHPLLARVRFREPVTPEHAG